MTKNEELEQIADPEVEQQDASQADTSDETSNPASENATEAESQADEVQGENEDADSGDTSESDVDDDDDAMVPLAKLKKVRNEAKNLRDRLKAAEDRVAELEAVTPDAALTNERDELKAEVERLNTQLNTERLSSHLAKAADESGAIEPAVVARLVDASSVQWGDDGTPTNLSDLIATIKTDFPKLFSAAQGTGNAGSRSEPRGQDESLTPGARLSNAYR